MLPMALSVLMVARLSFYNETRAHEKEVASANNFRSMSRNCNQASQYAHAVAVEMFETLPDYGGNRRNLQTLVGISKRAFNSCQTGWLELVQLDVMWEENSADNKVLFQQVRYSGVAMIDVASGDAVYFMSEISEPYKAGYASRVVELIGHLQAVVAEKDEWLEGVKYMWSPGRIL